MDKQEKKNLPDDTQQMPAPRAEPKPIPRGGDTYPYGGVDALGLASDGWVADGGGPGFQQNVEPARTVDGLPIPTELAITDTQTSGTQGYRAAKVGLVPGMTIVFGGSTGKCITKATLNLSQGWATMSVQWHQHKEGSHIDTSFSHTFPSVLGYGVTDIAGSNLLESEIQSASYDVDSDHLDRQNNVGQHLIGRSHGLTVTATITAVTNKTKDNITLGEGWNITSISTDRPSGNFHELTITAVKFIAA